MNRNLESLLRWSIENQAPPATQGGASSSPAASTAVTLPDNQLATIPGETVHDATEATIASSSAAASAGAGAGARAGALPQANNKLDPAILDAILGKSDAQRMMECVTDLKSDGKLSLDQKLQVWDELELLVENIDNANDLANMKLWQPIYDFLSDPEEEVRLQACWVLGTAIQNNPRSQTAFLELDPLPKLLDLLRSESNSELRSKTMYTLSGTLRHHPIAVERFTALDGWGVFNSCLQDPSVPLRRKTAFLIGSLFMNVVSEKEAHSYFDALQSSRTLDTLLSSLSKHEAVPSGADGEIEAIDHDYSDKTVVALATIVDKVRGTTKFAPEQKNKLKALLRELKEDDRIPADLAQSEWTALEQAAQSA